MPVQKSTETIHGFAADYWRADRVEIVRSPLSATAVYRLYKDATAAADKNPVKGDTASVSVSIAGGDTVLEIQDALDAAIVAEAGGKLEGGAVV